jgi:hypothetical protein
VKDFTHLKKGEKVTLVCNHFANSNQPTWSILYPERKENMVFQVVVIEEPSKNSADDGELEKLILGPITLVAKDKDSAGAIVCMENAGALKSVKKERMKVLVRPFG